LCSSYLSRHILSRYSPLLSISKKKKKRRRRKRKRRRRRRREEGGERRKQHDNHDFILFLFLFLSWLDSVAENEKTFVLIYYISRLINWFRHDLNEQSEN
jgi:hypothetical protein